MNNANGGNILFHFKGDTSNLKSATSSLGGMTKSILAATGITKALSAAWNLVSSSTDAAIDRYDQLNAFPKVMKSLGISQDKATESVNKLSEKLKGLPTTIDKGTSAVSRFVAANGDIERSTDMFLAVNNAILAGNAPMENQAAALEQITQAYSKGKPDMMEWRTLMTAMPGQLKQVAKAMGYVNTDQLHDALMDGTSSMDDFMDAIMRLNKEGVDGFDSFELAAKNATGGIKTAITNMKTAVARGVSGVIESIDKGLKGGGLEGGINGIIGKIGDTFETGLKTVGKEMSEDISGVLTGEITPEEIATKLVNKLSEGIKTGLEFINQNLPEYLPQVISFLSSLIGALGENLPDLVPLAGKLVETLANELTSEDNIKNIGIAGGKLGSGLIEGIKNYVAEPHNFDGVMDLIVGNMVSGGQVAGTKVGRSLIVGLVLGIAESLGYTDEELKALEEHLQGFIDNPIKFFFPKGWAIIESVWEGLKEALRLLKPGHEVNKEVFENVAKAHFDFFGLGANVVNGFIAGLKSKLTELRATATAIAAMVGIQIGKKNKIHSPSKLMEWYGEMMGEGYEIGLENMKGAIMDTAFDTFSISPQLQNSSALNYTPNVVVNNYVRNETDPLGQTVSQIKTFANGAKNDYNYGMGV